MIIHKFLDFTNYLDDILMTLSGGLNTASHPSDTGEPWQNDDELDEKFFFL